MAVKKEIEEVKEGEDKVAGEEEEEDEEKSR